MTLKNCPRCNTQTSNTAVWCHHCGEPIIETVDSNIIFRSIKIIGVVSTIVAAYVWFTGYPAGPTMFIGSLFILILGYLFEHQDFSHISKQ